MKRAAAGLVVALAAVLSTGCTVLAPVKTGAASYVLDRVPADLPRQAAHPRTLRVLGPEAVPLYATRRMVYSSRPFEVGYFNESEWALPPAQMIQPLLVETLRRAGYVVETASAPQSGPHAFSLRTEILDLRQDFSAEPATFRIAMLFSLRRQATHQLVTAKELSASAPIREKSAYAGVVAANEAIEKLLRALAEFAASNTE